jgi:peptide subunit release factor RF-3
MAVERECGISVSPALMSFEHEGLAFNLLERGVLRSSSGSSSIQSV